MAPKRRPAARSHRTMNSHRGRPNIPQLVYKFLRGAKVVGHSSEDTCQNCGLLQAAQEPSDSAVARQSKRRTMPKRRAKNGNRVSGKSRVEKRRRAGTEQLSSAVRTAHRSEDLTEIKNFIQKALDFGVKSGFLVAKDKSQRVLRVSSELIHDGECHDEVANDERAVSQERERSPRRTASKSSEFREEERNKRHKKRRRSRRRSRSGSKKRRRKSEARKLRKRSRSQVPEQPTDNCDERETENTAKGQAADDSDGNLEDPRANRSDGEKNVRKDDEENSDSSTAEEDSDEDEDKKEDDNDTNKS